MLQELKESVMVPAKWLATGFFSFMLCLGKFGQLRASALRETRPSLRFDVWGGKSCWLVGVRSDESRGTEGAQAKE